MTAENPPETNRASSPQVNDIGVGDIVNLLMRRWPVIAGVAVISTGLAFGATTVQKPHYIYSTTIQIGGPIGADGVKPIIEPPKLAGMLSVGHLIKSSAFSSRFPIASELEVKAIALGTSPLLKLEIEGTREDETAIIEYLAEINQLIIQECAGLIDLGQRQNLLARRLALAQKIEHLRTGITRNEQNLARIAEISRTYQARLTDAKASIGALTGERKSTISGVDPTLSALATLLTGNELQHSQENYFRIDEQLNDRIPRQREELNGAISRAQLELVDLDAEVQKTQSQLATLRETSVQIPPARLKQPIGSSTARILMIAFLAGALLGLFGAFLADLAAKQKSSPRA